MSSGGEAESEGSATTMEAENRVTCDDCDDGAAVSLDNGGHHITMCYRCAAVAMLDDNLMIGWDGLSLLRSPPAQEGAATALPAQGDPPAATSPPAQQGPSTTVPDAFDRNRTWPVDLCTGCQLQPRFMRAHTTAGRYELCRVCTAMFLLGVRQEFFTFSPDVPEPMQLL